MDPTMSFLLYDSLTSSVDYLKEEVAEQFNRARRAEAEAQKYLRLYNRSQEKKFLLNEMKKCPQDKCEKLDNFQNQLLQEKEATKERIGKMKEKFRTETDQLCSQIISKDEENNKLRADMVRLNEELLDVKSTLKTSETNRLNLLSYIENVLKVNNLTLTSPDHQVLMNSIEDSFSRIVNKTCEPNGPEQGAYVRPSELFVKSSKVPGIILKVGPTGLPEENGCDINNGKALLSPIIDSSRVVSAFSNDEVKHDDVLNTSTPVSVKDISLRLAYSSLEKTKFEEGFEENAIMQEEEKPRVSGTFSQNSSEDEAHHGIMIDDTKSRYRMEFKRFLLRRFFQSLSRKRSNS